MPKITVQPLPGYKEVKPFVYAGFFPVSNEDYNDLKEAIEKDKNIKNAERLVRKAVKDGAHVVALPEIWNSL